MFQTEVSWFGFRSLGVVGSAYHNNNRRPCRTNRCWSLTCGHYISKTGYYCATVTRGRSFVVAFCGSGAGRPDRPTGGQAAERSQRRCLPLKPNPVMVQLFHMCCWFHSLCTLLCGSGSRIQPLMPVFSAEWQMNCRPKMSLDARIIMAPHRGAVTTAAAPAAAKLAKWAINIRNS